MIKYEVRCEVKIPQVIVVEISEQNPNPSKHAALEAIGQSEEILKQALKIIPSVKLSGINSRIVTIEKISS